MKTALKFYATASPLARGTLYDKRATLFNFFTRSVVCKKSSNEEVEAK